MMQKPTLAQIEKGTENFATAYRALESLIKEISDLQAQVMTTRQRKLAELVHAHCETEGVLLDLIKAAPELFESPRTQIFHGIKVGFRKGTGGISIEDEERTIELIEKHLKEQADILIHTEKSVVKKALNELDVKDLKQIGCMVEGTADVPVITPTESSAAKQVKALVKAARAKKEKVTA
jgi:NCAIR mutase (PurE)-related protein